MDGRGVVVVCISVNMVVEKSKLLKSCENKLGEGLIEGNEAKLMLESPVPVVQLSSDIRLLFD